MANNQHCQDAGDSGKRQETKDERSERKAESHERGEVASSFQNYNDALKAESKEQKVSGRSRVTGKGKNAEGGGGFSSAKDLLGDLAHETLTKDVEKKNMSPERKAQLMAEVERDSYIVGKPKEQTVSKGSAENTGKVTDYKPKHNSPDSFSLGMNYEDGKQDTRDIGARFGDFAAAAARNATDPKGWQTWFDGEVLKMKGVAEGLNEAKEETKATAVAGFKALTDGTVAGFLSKPNAINEPLFKAIGKVFDAVSSDPNATNKALEALGHAVMKASNDYSQLPKEEQGKVIGKVAFAMMNPEGSTEGAEVALKVADKVATQVDKAVMDTVALSVKAAERAAQQSPEMALQAKQRLLDYLESKGLLGQKPEYARVPDGYFEGIQPSRNAAKDNYLAMSKDDTSELNYSVEKQKNIEPIERPSQSFRDYVQTQIESLSADELAFLQDRNIEIKTVKRLPDAVPNSENLGACFNPSDNTIYIPEEVLSFGEWVPNKNVPHSLRHEYGHVLNARFNPLSEKNLSDLEPFKDAFNEDLKKLSDEKLAELRLLHRGPVERRDEVFADIYGHVSGMLAGTACNSPYSDKIKEAFEKCFEYLKEALTK